MKVPPTNREMVHREAMCASLSSGRMTDDDNDDVRVFGSEGLAKNLVDLTNLHKYCLAI